MWSRGESHTTAQGRLLPVLSEPGLPASFEAHESGLRGGSGFTFYSQSSARSPRLTEFLSSCNGAFIFKPSFIEQLLHAGSTLGTFQMLSQEIFVTPNSSRSWSILSSTTVPRASSSLLWKMTVASVLGSLPPYCNQLLLSEVHVPSEQPMSLRVNLKLLSLVYRCSVVTSCWWQGQSR